MATLMEKESKDQDEKEKQKIIEKIQDEKEPEDPLDYLDSSQDAMYFLESDDDEFKAAIEEDEGEDSDQDYKDTNDPAIRRLRWLKKAPKDDKDKEEERKKMLDEKEKQK